MAAVVASGSTLSRSLYGADRSSQFVTPLEIDSYRPVVAKAYRRLGSCGPVAISTTTPRGRSAFSRFNLAREESPTCFAMAAVPAYPHWRRTNGMFSSFFELGIGKPSSSHAAFILRMPLPPCSIKWSSWKTRPARTGSHPGRSGRNPAASESAHASLTPHGTSSDSPAVQRR